jgi:hypothetical protein
VRFSSFLYLAGRRHGSFWDNSRYTRHTGPQVIPLRAFHSHRPASARLPTCAVCPSVCLPVCLAFSVFLSFPAKLLSHYVCLRMRNGQPCAIEVTSNLHGWRVNSARLGRSSASIRGSARTIWLEVFSRAADGRYTMNGSYMRARVYIYIHVCVYTYIYVHIHISMYMYIYIHMCYTCICTCIITAAIYDFISHRWCLRSMLCDE